MSLFTGCGGLDLGLEGSGFSTRLCVEIDEDAKQTLRRNRPRWRISEPGDIHALNPSEILLQAGIYQGELDLLAGGPPCQPFSKSGYWVNGGSARLSDPRASTIRAYLDALEATLPRVLLFENVEGFNFRKKDEGVRLLQHTLDHINHRHGTAYRPKLFLVNAADYGVPQNRKRVFIVAERNGKTFHLPSQTHAPVDQLDCDDANYMPHVTAWDAIGDLDNCDWPIELDATGKWADLLPSIPEGHNYLWHTPRSGGTPLFSWRSRYWSFLLKLAKNKPSWTIQAQPGPATGPFHWRNRRLSIRELCRLQTFPDDFVPSGHYKIAHRQIGNAVPPLIGYLLGLEIRRQLLGERVRKTSKFSFNARSSCPRRSPTKNVKKHYLPLQGKHRDHPGTGKGPRSRDQRPRT